MVAPAPLSKPRSSGNSADDTCGALGRMAPDGPCREILVALCERENALKTTTFWDLHQIIGLPLHEAFAALRTLEYGKVIDILDNPSDPFGAVLKLRSSGFETMQRYSAA